MHWSILLLTYFHVTDMNIKSTKPNKIIITCYLFSRCLFSCFMFNCYFSECINSSSSPWFSLENQNRIQWILYIIINTPLMRNNITWKHSKQAFNCIIKGISYKEIFVFFSQKLVLFKIAKNLKSVLGFHKINRLFHCING